MAWRSALNRSLEHLRHSARNAVDLNYQRILDSHFNPNPLLVDKIYTIPADLQEIAVGSDADHGGTSEATVDIDPSGHGRFHGWIDPLGWKHDVKASSSPPAHSTRAPVARPYSAAVSPESSLAFHPPWSSDASLSRPDQYRLSPDLQRELEKGQSSQDQSTEEARSPTVMEVLRQGRSESSPGAGSRADDHQRNGGFALFRNKVRHTIFDRLTWNTEGFSYLVLRVRSSGDNQRYFVNIQCESPIPSDLWQHPLVLKTTGIWEDVYLAFDNFVLTSHGRIAQDQLGMVRDKIRTVGVSILTAPPGSGGKMLPGSGGQFELGVDAVWMANEVREGGRLIEREAKDERLWQDTANEVGSG